VNNIQEDNQFFFPPPESYEADKYTLNEQASCFCDRASLAKREERIVTRCNNIDVLLSIPDVDY